MKEHTLDWFVHLNSSGSYSIKHGLACVTAQCASSHVISNITPFSNEELTYLVATFQVRVKVYLLERIHISVAENVLNS